MKEDKTQDTPTAVAAPSSPSLDYSEYQNEQLRSELVKLKIQRTDAVRAQYKCEEQLREAKRETTGLYRLLAEEREQRIAQASQVQTLEPLLARYGPCSNQVFQCQCDICKAVRGVTASAGLIDRFDRWITTQHVPRPCVDELRDFLHDWREMEVGRFLGVQ